ncbi:hypothetical protein ACHAPJ_010613 [Fusarium lateritium]
MAMVLGIGGSDRSAFKFKEIAGPKRKFADESRSKVGDNYRNLDPKLASLSMSVAFVTLPTEVLDSILESLTMDEVVNLWKTNNLLSHRIEEYLFGHPAALNYTMK